MKINKTFLFVLLLVGGIVPLDKTFCQRNEVFIYSNSSDSLINLYMHLHDRPVYKQPYWSVSILNWREKLPDGIYYYLDEHHPKKHNYLMRVQYHDSVRVGRSEYWTYCEVGPPRKRKEERMLTITYGYNNKGLLDGYYLSNYCGHFRNDEGYYKDGKRHGFFITYDYDEKAKQNYVGRVELYRNDTLIYKSEENMATEAIEYIRGK